MIFFKRSCKILLLSIFVLLLSPLATNAHGHHAGDVTLPANRFDLDFLTVFYEFNSDNTITMAIRCNIPNQYFSLGLGASMVGSDIWVFELVDDQVTVNDYRGEHHTYPSLDESVGGQNDLVRLGYEIAPEYTLVKIKRVLDTGDMMNDRPIQPGPVDFIYATGPSPVIAYHSQRGITQVVLVGREDKEEILSPDDQKITSGDVTRPPHRFDLEFLTVYYEFNSDSTITMAIQCNIPNQFFALGLGTSMLDSDIWVFELVGNEVMVNDYRGEQHTYPSLDTSVGGQDDLERLGYEITPEYSLVKIRRVLDTGDTVNDKPIQPGSVDFLYATGPSPVPTYHDQKGIAQVVLIGHVDEEVIVNEEADEEMLILEETEDMLTEEHFVSEEFNEEWFEGFTI